MKDLKVLRWMSLFMLAVLVLEFVQLLLRDEGLRGPEPDLVLILFFVLIALEIIRSALKDLSTQLEELRARLAKGTDS